MQLVKYWGMIWIQEFFFVLKKEKKTHWSDEINQNLPCILYWQSAPVICTRWKFTCYYHSGVCCSQVHANKTYKNKSILEALMPLVNSKPWSEYFPQDKPQSKDQGKYGKLQGSNKGKYLYHDTCGTPPVVPEPWAKLSYRSLHLWVLFPLWGSTYLSPWKPARAHAGSDVKMCLYSDIPYK